MRFVADENIARATVERLREVGHDVAWVSTDAPGSTDEQVLARAVADDRILITADKDFGELAFAGGSVVARGIILLRVRGSTALRTAALLAAVEARTDWAGHFAVVEQDRVRMTRLPD
jgi:predicted nuclease of predicted toxin-antitoxin system